MAGDHFFFVIEGLDGSGKSEVSRRLAQLLRQTLGDRVLLTFEPHDPSGGGMFIRQALTHRVKTSNRALALAYAFNRADHNARVITPFLELGGQRVVVCDRYYLSSLVYQSADDLPMHEVMTLNEGARQPDLILFLDASAETCYARMNHRNTARELFDANLAEMRAKYYAAIDYLMARGERIVTIDANPDLLTVLNDIIDVLNERAPDWLVMQRVLLLEDAAPLSVEPEGEANLDLLIEPFADIWRDAGDDHRARDAALRAAVFAEVNRLSAAALGGLFLAYLRWWGFAPAERIAWTEMAAYRLAYTLPTGIVQRGAAVLYPERGRYTSITRKLQEVDDLHRVFDFVLLCDPAPLGDPARLHPYERDAAGGLTPNTRIVGREDMARFLLAQADRRFRQTQVPVMTPLP